MAEQIRLWKIEHTDGVERLAALPQTKLDLEARLEAWALGDISIISDDLLVIAHHPVTDAGGEVDILCLSREGDLVIVELKRDKTPRDVTAQVLDYGAWANRLSNEQITRIAEKYLKQDLGEAFADQFGEELPEVLNENHRLLIVATMTDPRTERIVQYLSEVYGVNINVLWFSYFRTPDGRELVGRTHLLEPEFVEQRTQERSSSKRKPNLTREQLASEAEESGVGDLYERMVDALNDVLLFTRTRSSVAFKAKLDGGKRATFNLIPAESSEDAGLKFQAYTNRLAEVFGVTPELVRDVLPREAIEWAYGDYEETEPEWRGHEGYLQKADVDRIVAWLQQQHNIEG